MKVSRRGALKAAGTGLTGIGAALPAAAKEPAGALRADRLRVEWREAPVGIDTLRPRFTWEPMARDADARALTQSASRILVARSRAALNAERGNVWDSGRVAGSRPAAQPPTPLALDPHRDYHWTVETWDQAGKSCGRSAPARFVTGLLAADQWQAEWIAATPDRPSGPHSRGNDRSPAKLPEPLPIFRRTFDLSGRLRRAILSIAALGHGDVTINGAPVTRSMLNPGWTDYRRTILYTSHDITALLVPGPNAIGVMLGNGMYNVERVPGRYVKFVDSFGQPKLIARLDIELTDGSTRTIVSDRNWQTREGPIRYSNVYGGEDVDGRLEVPGWDRPGAAGADWRTPFRVEGPSGTLRAQGIPGIEVQRTITPLRVTPLSNGRVVYDFGENCSARARMVLRGPAGSRICLRPGEALGPDGGVSQRSFNASPKNETRFEYILAGRGAEVFQPRFIHQGFRYLEAELLPPEGGGEAPRIEKVEVDFVHAGLIQVGNFDSSEKLFVDTHRLIDQALRSNMASVLTDCPHREKLGWLEQTHLNAPTILYNRDAAALYEKMAIDIADAQQADGMVPGIAPEYVAFLDKDGGDTIWRNSPEWGVAAVLSPWAAYRAYGDRTVLEMAYPSMGRYMAYLAGRATDEIVDFGMGDWYDLGPRPPGESQLTSRALAGTACRYQALRALADIAGVIGRPAETARWTAQAGAVLDAFNRRFFHVDRASYDTGSQCALAMPLALGMVPAGRERAVLDNLVAAVRANGNGVTAGDVGFRYVIDALTAYRRDEVIDAMMRVTDRPGYGQQLQGGATALAEAWDANPTKSLNHFMLGHGEGWLYGALAGIRIDFAAAEPQRIVTIAPRPVGTTRAAAARHRSVLGEIVSRWHKDGGRFVLEATIPPGPGGTVMVPTSAPERVTESGKPVPGTPVPGGLEVLLGSGRYRFEAAV
ncbi:alpha-L-rhamnosidase [Sphingomonas psychrotolerans]|uniref:alpha-L-rhamnosidase n=1 Tax=Sphingomonas psychrotolerans TaxID=1327635 RepID=A0A2K8MI63_9SPHN|nr:alpha-L-rhamnosidase [Sphingomonas psychrotolerans]